MSNLKITGYGDDLTIDNIRLGDLSPAEHESIEKEKGGQNYKPLERSLSMTPHNDVLHRYVQSSV